MYSVPGRGECALGLAEEAAAQLDARACEQRVEVEQQRAEDLEVVGTARVSVGRTSDAASSRLSAFISAGSDVGVARGGGTGHDTEARYGMQPRWK
ncbi:MAG: hypothetical protein JRG90_14585 [Deltaproteobacteria bacterium]|nr:hypothetical protein [Deltaproteobacteria bacterium]